MSISPPKTIEELRHLYIKIRNGKHTIRLTDRTLTVLKHMLDDPNETAAKSISEIARENNINISSITRLAQKLGFSGFPGLKDIFRSSLKQRKNFYSEQVKKFLQKGSVDHDGKTSLLERVIQDEWSNVMLMADTFDEQKFATIIKLMINAERILIVGLRGSYPLAHYLGFYLKMIRNGVSIIGQAGHTLADDLSALKSGDLLVAISINPYTKATADACHIGKLQAADIIAITDNLSSPLAMETDNFLIASAEGNYFFNPMVAAIICIETLLSELVKQLGDKAIQRLNHIGYILEELETEIS
ncbi:MAG: MurR/RpiR family transcriptional regulator [Desulfobacula sp.]|uniref:MurR/RpiR family transcriptional regulator n=1 Tax=Desulfobacula sp. TaxID=2593537 RepID=UPI0025B8881C|nr:MurR/RpiR family transcriptional regulator [Desulfobacula sp.]MCD4720633.1 MurR/RpiR family transcriptional regulator [Desulfobacula sp.]